MAKSITIKGTSWGTEYTITKVPVDEQHVFLDVQFGGNGKHHRSRRNYSHEHADRLVKGIASHTKIKDFPWNDKRGIRQWRSYDPDVSIDF